MSLSAGLNGFMAPAKPTRLWYFVWKLLRLRWLIFLSTFRHSKPIRKVGTIIVAIIVFFVFVGVFVVSFFLLRFLHSPELVNIIGDTTDFVQNVPMLLLGAAFLGILLTSFGVLLQALYLAGDMDFLLSSPVPIRAVFISKMLQAILPNFSLISLFSLPVLYGLGFASGYNLFYYPLVLITLVLLALAAAGLSALLVMGIVRIFPARRVAEVLGFLGAILSMICSQSGNLANSMNYGNISGDQVSKSFDLLNRLNSPLSPFYWIGRGLVDLGEGRWLTGLGFTILMLGLCGTIFFVSLNTAERLYFNGWARMQVSARKKKVARPNHTAIERPSLLKGRLERVVPAQIRSIVYKDLLMTRRDLRNMSQVVTPLIFGVIYSFMLLRGGGQIPAGRGEAPELFMQGLRTAYIYVSVGISLFVSWSLLARLAGVSFSQEGKQYWMLKSAPVSGRRLLISKYLVAYLPALALSLVFLLAIGLMQRAQLSVILYGLPVVVLCTAGNAGINLAFGVTGVNLDWSDPRHMISGSSGCLGALASIFYLVVSLALFFLPPIAASLLSLPAIIGQLVGLLLGGVFSLAGAFVPLMMVLPRVERIGNV